jgi:hypothetical protein
MSAPGAGVQAAVTGVHLGRGRTAPVSLRLFRRGGTRIAVLASPVPGRLVLLRAAAAGASTTVVTPKPAAWSAVGGVQLVPPGTAAATDLVIDDSRRADVAALGPVAGWQCRIELRTPFAAGDVLALTNADLILTSRLDADIAGGLRSGFGLSREDARALTTLDPAAIAVVHRGGVRVVALDPTPAENAVLARMA